MIAERIVEALTLPASTRVDLRIHKTVLTKRVAATAADRRLIKDGVEELHWLASLKKTNIGVPVFTDGRREYLEIAILHLQTRAVANRGAKLMRLLNLLHRAIPYPVLLVVEAEETTLSMAHKRWAQNEKDKMVLEDGYPHTTPIAPDVPETFWHDLALDRQPSANIMALYQGWLACLLALDAWRETGCYRSPQPQNIDHLPELRRLLFKVRDLSEQIASLRRQAAKERQMARQVELNLKLKRIEAQRTALLNELSQGA